MSAEKHPFDEVAEGLQATEDQPVADQDASPDYWELSFAADQSVGDYPQAVPVDDKEWVNVLDASEDGDGLGPDGFPSVANGLPKVRLQKNANWTDVLSSVFWSEGYLFNDKAQGLFQQFNLGEFREYPAIVFDSAGVERYFKYVFVRNIIESSALDFKRSEFYFVNSIRRPQTAIEINSFDEWLEMDEKACDGELDGIEESSSVEYKKLFFNRGYTQSVDLFVLDSLSQRVYVSTQLKEVIIQSGITGLAIKSNRRLFLA